MKKLIGCWVFGVSLSVAAMPDNRNLTKSEQNEDPYRGLAKLPLKCELRYRIDRSAVVAKLTFGNLGPSSVTVLKRNLLLDGRLTLSAFVISRNGAKVPYRGMTTKAASPTLDDYTEIRPLETKSAQIALNTYYDLRVAGHYRVQYRAIQANPADGKLALTLSNVIEFEIP